MRRWKAWLRRWWVTEVLDLKSADTKGAVLRRECLWIPVRRSDNTSGHTGITRQYEKWNASISYAGRRYRLGAYENLEEAIVVRKQAEKLVAQHDLEGLLKLTTGPGTLNNPKKA